KPNDEIAYTLFFPAGPATATAVTPAGTLTSPVKVPATTGQAFPVKSGPNIARAIPAAAQTLPLTVASRMIVAIYGERLAAPVWPVKFAGANPSYPWLDQINCQLPAGTAANPAAPVVVTSAGRSSNPTTLPIQ